jgi:ethanolamine utilization protein EutQ (cupin superfamily)
MAKVSRESAANVEDFGAAEDRNQDIGGYTVNFVTMREDVDLAPMLKGLPDDSCQCPHWGYVLKGRLTWRIGDREEVCEAGDAYYVPPGHSPKAEAGSEFVQFSPTEELQASQAAIAANMQNMQGA